MGMFKYIEDTFCMIFRPKVYEAKILAEFDSISIEGNKRFAEEKLGKKILTKDDAEMLCSKAAKTICSFCDDKTTIQLKDIPIIKQVRTATNFALNGEEYEKSYVQID